MNFTKGMASSEFGVMLTTIILPMATDLSELKFLGICAVACAFCLGRSYVKSGNSG